MTKSEVLSSLKWESYSIYQYLVPCVVLWSRNCVHILKKLLDRCEHDKDVVDNFLNHAPWRFPTRQPKNWILDREDSTGLKFLPLRDRKTVFRFSRHIQDSFWLCFHICKLFVHEQNHCKTAQTQNWENYVDVQRNLFWFSNKRKYIIKTQFGI